ncbi:porin [Porticoccaceae bacterium]|nr:porin [Porticoccaceae bacterium]
MNKKLLALVIGLNLTATAQAETPDLEKMWQIIQQQQAEIAALKGQLQETEIKTEATISAVEQFSVIPASASKTTFGGYGEVHYNNLEKDDSSGTKDAIDFHRFVMFTGHQFTDNIRFFSELEVEHSIAGEGKPGEIELEQAYIEWNASDNLSAKAGLFLVPIGILNETHEPDTFYGTERNNVEKNIIPVTWWEAGAAIKGEISEGFSYDLAAHSGLYIPAGKYKPRDGRQKVGKAKADNGAFTGRLKYTGIPGLELAASVQHQVDITQGEGSEPVDGTLFEAHVAWQSNDFQLRALYAQWDFDNAINAYASTAATDYVPGDEFTLATPASDGKTITGADEQKGFFIEPSYRITDKVGVFARYSEYDNLAGNSADTAVEQIDLGLNYWLHPNVVFKFDYQNQDAPGNTGYDGINVGVGYSF